ncbi:acyl-CoA dehydrogenase family protein [Kibdelosporangium philippinense]|uniref:acyl-CoA dehydrogenase family protein n=1 Tax=Kibdelosporangium philippinense TaxID=211113 RepID=UPI003621FEB7
MSQNGIFLLAPTLFAHGTPEQCARLLPKMASAEEVWAQAWSEPEAGSDLAAIRASATRTEGGWLLRGQKTWSSRATFADRGFGFVPHFRGKTPGPDVLHVLAQCSRVTVRPINQLDGEPGFAEIFLDDVFVPDEDVIGDVDNGWKVAMSTASNERGLLVAQSWTVSGDRATARRPMAGVARTCFTRSRCGRVDRCSGVSVVHVRDRHPADGRWHSRPESSVNKLFWSELDIAMHETALDLLGGEGEADGPWLDGYLFSLAGPIYAGTNEIQRNVVAERILGLPR